ncbi:MAG TPA: DOMON domain-containing protein [Candidatus Sabulitectum sp.]|nr:DOMON domain-containing protein [Candidatus Sabulitectum sp.]
MKITMLVLAAIAAVSAGQAWQEITVDGFTLRWATVEGNNLAVQLNGPTTGWVAVGFDPTQMMLNANIIIGYVASGTPELRDDWGWQTTSHRDDTLLGGTSDLTVDGGFESGGSTEIHFTIPLDSGDAYDKALSPGGTYPIILARSADGQDNFTAPHSLVTSASITIEALSLEPGTWGSIKAF